MEKEKEHKKRLSKLYTDSHKKLVKYAYGLTKDMDDAEDLVSNLYEYLLVKQNDKLFWRDSYNILYCNKFIYSRFINSQTRGMKYVPISEELELEDIEYDIEKDKFLEELHQKILNELKELERTKLWASAKIFQLYTMSDKTLQKVADDIGISKSTTFLAVKKIRTHLQNKFGHY